MQTTNDSGHVAGGKTEADTSVHTATPWAQSHRRQPDGMYNTEIYCAAGKTIATISWYPRPPTADGVTRSYREANAEFVVRACNAHQDLVTACQRALSHYERIRGDKEDTALMTNLRRALAKAGANN